MMDAIHLTIALVVFGLILGRFLTVCVFRIPYGREKGPGDFAAEADAAAEEAAAAAEASPEEGERMSVLYPVRSFCPECRHQLSWRHNIPLFSWLLLGGKCAYCRAPIPVRYPAIELLSALTCVLSYYTAGNIPTALVLYAFCCGLLVVTFIDIEYYIIPDVISFPGMALGLAAAAVNQLWAAYHGGAPLFTPPVVPTIAAALWGLLAGGGFLYAVAELYRLSRGREGLGLGDVKLLAVVGLFFGWQASLYTIFVGSVVGSVLGVAQLLVQGHKLSRPLPFGPYLAIAALLFLFSDPELPRVFVQNMFFAR